MPFLTGTVSLFWIGITQVYFEKWSTYFKSIWIFNLYLVPLQTQLNPPETSHMFS